MSSTLFPKNRQQAQRWQRKQTAVNSHNDRFTIYAQIEPHLHLHAHADNGNSNHNNNNVDTNTHQHNNLNGRYQRTNVDSHNSETETPIARSQISKLRETLENLQRVNFGDGQDRPVCRNIGSSRNKEININIEHSQQQNESHQDYNRKLDIMKQRLQMISRKQYKDKDKDKIMKSKQMKNLQSPLASMSGSLGMAMGGQSGAGSRNLSSKNNSQQSTKRDKGGHYGKGGAMGYGYKDYQNYRNQMRDSRESRGSHNRDSQELVRKLQDSSIRAAKNTVPMPTIIHEDEFQLQTQHRISSTINFPQYSSKHFQKPQQYSQYKRHKQTAKHQQIQHNFQYQHENSDEPLHVKSHINTHIHGNAISQKKIGTRNSNVNVKFSHSQSYYQLFPSLSDQIGFGKGKKELDKQSGGRGSQGRHRRDMQLFGEMRNRLDTIQASWVNGFADRKVGSQIRFKQSGTKQSNPSNQPTKRKQGRTPQHAQSRSRSNTAILFNEKQRKQEKDKRSNNTRSITQKDSGMNNGKRPNIMGNKKEAKMMNADVNGRSININTAPNLHPSSYNDYYSKLTPTAQTQSNILPIFQQQSNGLKIHRAPIKQMLFNINANNVVDIFTGSLDYQVKYTTLDPTQPISTSLYKHRGPITALQQTPTILMSTSTDLYLKYTQNPTLGSLNEVPTPTPTMFRFASCPQQLSLIDFQHVLVGCKKQLCLFDLNLNQIAIQVGISGNYTLMQNEGVVYVGQDKALSVVDFRIQGGIVKVCDELPNVNRWMMHPFQEFCIIQCDNMLLQMNLRLRTQSRKTRAIYQIANETKIKYHSFNISSAINPMVSRTHNLTLLTQQSLQASFSNSSVNQLGNKQTVRNKILQLQLNQNGILQQSYVSLFAGSKQYCTNLSNSFNIVKSFGSTVYAGAKDGSLYGFVAQTKKRGQAFGEEGRSKSRSRANASVSRSKDARKR